MRRQEYDHILNLKITRKMIDDIDAALIEMKHFLLCSRSDFIRAATAYALSSLAESRVAGNAETARIPDTLASDPLKSAR